MSVSAVVPVYNGREWLQLLLQSLAVQILPIDELIVVDNGSQDGAPDVARKAGARVIEMGRNAGFAAAVNRGIRESRGEWIAVLNSDVELAPDYIERLVTAGALFATGKILNRTTGAIDGTYDALSRGGTAWRVGSGFKDGPEFSKLRAIWSAPWTAVLFRADLFQKIGLLEESFESYLEDVDFGLRCLRAGLPGLYVPDAVAWHRGSATLGRWHPDTVRRISRNQILLLARHYPARLLFRWWWKILVAQLLWGAVAARHRTGFSWLRGKIVGLVRGRAARRAYLPTEPTVLEQVLTENEESIYRIQEGGTFDSYWKLYFLLTRGGAK